MVSSVVVMKNIICLKKELKEKKRRRDVSYRWFVKEEARVAREIRRRTENRPKLTEHQFQILQRQKYLGSSLRELLSLEESHLQRREIIRVETKKHLRMVRSMYRNGIWRGVIQNGGVNDDISSRLRNWAVEVGITLILRS
ncbi:hypothetical protein V6N13_054139 [Hibiscus sabdariffa]|uniref:Uncharacterized protein n=1 Tax=Hibiscus sabdariffa TaxID=183260 RepID=A0ABR2E0D9_9ROSI